jgi:hypothetical protein
MMRSYDLFSRYVAPHFQGQFRTMTGNREWVVATGGGPYGGGPGGGGAQAGGPGSGRI